MTRILQLSTTRKMAMAKEKRSFESALASILEELDLSFSLKVEQEYALKSFISKKDIFG